MVDSAAVSTWILASCLQKVPLEIRPAILGHGLPVRHVHRLHVPISERNQLPATACDSSLFYLFSTGWLDNCFAGVDGNSGEKHSATGDYTSATGNVRHGDKV